MKILHTGDWHLGKRLERFERLPEQREVMAEIVEITRQEDPDLVLIAGDLFDTFNPSSEAQELLYTTLTDCADHGARAVVAIAGNHDSPDRVRAPEILARRHGIVLAGYPDDEIGTWRAGNVTVRGCDPGMIALEIDRPALRGVPVHLLLAPYANEVRMRRALGSDPDRAVGELLSERWHELLTRHGSSDAITLMVAHLLFARDARTAEEEQEGERPIAHVGGAPAIGVGAVPAAVQYVAAGHLHRPHSVGGTSDGNGTVRYSGSPLSYSFAEAGQTKSVTIVEVDQPGTLGAVASWWERPLTAGRPLIRYRSDSVDDALAWLGQHQEALVEVVLELPAFLSAEDRNRLHAAHDGLVTIVPVVAVDAEAATADGIDPGAAIDELFVQFFRHRTGEAPDEAMRELFAEVRAAGGA